MASDLKSAMQRAREERKERMKKLKRMRESTHDSSSSLAPPEKREKIVEVSAPDVEEDDGPSCLVMGYGSDSNSDSEPESSDDGVPAVSTVEPVEEQEEEPSSAVLPSNFFDSVGEQRHVESILEKNASDDEGARPKAEQKPNIDEEMNAFDAVMDAMKEEVAEHEENAEAELTEVREHLESSETATYGKKLDDLMGKVTKAKQIALERQVRQNRARIGSKPVHTPQSGSESDSDDSDDSDADDELLIDWKAKKAH